MGRKSNQQFDHSNQISNLTARARRRQFQRDLAVAAAAAVVWKANATADVIGRRPSEGWKFTQNPAVPMFWCSYHASNCELPTVSDLGLFGYPLRYAQLWIALDMLKSA